LTYSLKENPGTPSTPVHVIFVSFPKPTVFFKMCASVLKHCRMMYEVYFENTCADKFSAQVFKGGRAGVSTTFSF
jgi:hypothetical protein